MLKMSQVKVFKLVRLLSVLLFWWWGKHMRNIQRLEDFSAIQNSRQKCICQMSDLEMIAVHNKRVNFYTIIINIEIRLIKYWHFPGVHKNFVIYNYSIKICADFKEGEISFKLSFRLGSIFG